MSSYLKNKRILITGATGFIGANLTKRCIEIGADVYIFSRDTSNKWRIKDILKDVKNFCVDLLDYENLEKFILEIKPEIIFHTATYGGYPFQKEGNKIINTNVIGTINLVNICTKVGFEVFINTGSSSEYGIKFKPMKESAILEPINDYGISKATATLFCQMKAKAEKLPIVTLRLFSPYGYYEEKTRLIPSVIISCLENKTPKLSSPKSIRDFVFIEDVIDSYFKVVKNKNKIAGEIFNIGSGQQHSVGKIVNAIIKLTNSKVKPQWQTVINPRVEPKFWQADISKAKKILKWEPKYDLEQGLEKTISWFRKNLILYRSKG